MSPITGVSAIRDDCHVFIDPKKRTPARGRRAHIRKAAHWLTYSARRASIGSKEAARIAG